ncbi:MAG: hypothetical protein ABIQ16_04970 [Polyangiaceae bacterium]
MSSRLALLLSLCALVGCKGEAGPGVSSGSSSRPAAVASTTPAASPAGTDAGVDSVVSQGFDSAVARAFVERWLAAQNAHDFAAYSGMYAKRFAGTKRVGGYLKRFDHDGWLRDRQPMFRDGVVVRTSEVQLSGSAGAVRVVFTQDFVAPGFHDTGKKELFLVAEPSGFAISREEMLVSQVGEAAPATDSSVLAFHRDGVVLGSGLSEALPGKPRLLPRGGSNPYDVGLPVEVRALSKEARAWLGKSVTVFARDGAQCQGVVTRFEVRVSSEPHFGMRQTWAGEGGVPKASPAQIAQEIWGIARNDERFVVGVLDHECHGVWAVAHALTFTPAVAPPATLRAQALAAFKALPAYRELQARFAQETSNPEQSWENVDGVLSVVLLSSSAESSLVVVAARGGVGCGTFGGNLSAIWKVSGSGSAPKLTSRGVFKDAADLLQVHGAFDQNADGTLELLAGPDVFADEISVLRLGANGYERNVLFATSFWDCGC